MRLAHCALWTADLEAAAEFWRRYFGAEVGAIYESRNRIGFRSRFVQLSDGGTIELMTGPWVKARSGPDTAGWDHIAVSLGSEAAVQALAERCRADGCLVSAPRWTGDGFYEAVIRMPDGTPVEITS